MKDNIADIAERWSRLPTTKKIYYTIWIILQTSKCTRCILTVLMIIGTVFVVIYPYSNWAMAMIAGLLTGWLLAKYDALTK